MINRLKRLFRFTPVNPVVLLIPCVLALLTLQYLTLYTSFNNSLAFLSVAIALLAVLLVISQITGRLAARRGPSTDLLRNYTPDMNALLYNEIHAPIAACDLYGVIRWGNKAFRDIVGEDSRQPHKFSDIAGIGIDSVISTLQGGKVCRITVDGRIYRLEGIQIGQEQERLFVTVWYDETDYENCKQQLAENDALVAYIYIDNLEELSQIERGRFGSAIADVEKLLYDWAAQVHGILINYEREKFVLFYKSKYLNAFMDNNFQILDKVREVRVGSGYLPITISVGTSNVGRDFSEKNDNAYSALEFALSKGGDQAIVKTDKFSYVYGGMTKTAQKRSSVKSQTIARALSAYICRASNVLIMGHRTPDFDSIGSCVGIARLCMYLQVPCNIIIDRNSPNIQKCFKMLSDLPEYDDLFISGDKGLDRIREDTLMIICDVNNYRQFEAADVAERIGSVVYIDHHRLTEEFKVQPLLSYVEPSASSASELVTEILQQVSEQILRPKEAGLMYAGIVLDTKHFVVNTGVRTFESARYLRSLGDPSEIRELFKTGIDEIMRESRFAITDPPYRDHIMIVQSDYPDNTDIDITLAAKTADRLLDIDGIDASFVILRLGGAFRISGRSSGGINVEKILRRLGGGGHFNAAAAQPQVDENTTMEEIRKRLTDSIDIFLDQEINREKV